MSTHSHFSRDLQRKVVRTLLVLAVLMSVVAVPLIIMDDLRLNVAQQLGIVPGRSAEQLADADDGATLVVLPLGNDSGVGQERYRYKAQFIARPVKNGMELTAIDIDKTAFIPLAEIQFIAADATGDNVLFRGPSSDTGEDVTVLVASQTMEVEPLPAGQPTPSIDGDWDTPVWAKTFGLCDRYSPEEKFVACFNRADAASYLAGDWQIDVQLFGDFQAVEPVYRGAGFLPVLGFAHQDQWIYFQNEKGIWKVEVPESLQKRTRSNTSASFPMTSPGTRETRARIGTEVL